MNADKLPHPTRDQLTAFGLGRLDEEASARVEKHLGECDACRATVEAAPADTLVSLLRTEPTTGDWLPDAPPAPPVPAALNDHPRYRVVELLGAGGMGAVYRAEHRLMERPVALKVIRRKLFEDPAAVERFRREAKAAARLSHPNIVTAYDAEQAGEAHFLVMEFVEGVSLARLVAEQGPLPVDRACEWVRQAALGLQHAHEQGMVHRDVKPQNLMLTPRGEVKILDFGLARFVSESGPTGALTQSGTLMGTPDYIAPEQATNAHAADTRADVYSLGCTLYFLLTGRPPFADGSFVEKLAAHLHQKPPPVTSLRRDVPAELARVVERMLAKDPAQRYQTPGEVAQALAPLARPAPAPPPRRRWLLVAAAVALLGLVAAGAVFRIVTARGTLVIETDDPDIRVVVSRGGELVEIIDPKSGKEVRLRAGEYEVKLGEGRQGLKLSTDRFTLERGGKAVVWVRMEKKLPPPPPAPAAEGPAPLDASRFLVVRDLDFRRAKDRRPEFEHGGHLTTDYKDGEYRLVQKNGGLWMSPELTPFLGNYVYEVEGRLAGPADSGWGLGLLHGNESYPWLGAQVRGDGQVCLHLHNERGLQPLPWRATPALRSAAEFNKVRVEHEAPTVRLFVNGRFVGQADVPGLLPGGSRLYLFSGAKEPLPEGGIRRLRVWRIPSVAEGRPPTEPTYQADFRKPVAEFPEKDDRVCGYDRGRFFVKAGKGRGRPVGSCPPKPLGDFYAEVTAQVTAGKGGSWALVCGAGRDIGTRVEVRQDGSYRVCRVSDGQVHNLQGPLSPAVAPAGWQRHPDLKPDVLNTVGVAVRGRMLTVYFNGQWACDVVDPNYVAGPLQLAARAEGEPVRAEFQSLRVWASPAPRDTSKLPVVRDLDFRRPGDRLAEFTSGFAEMPVDYQDGEYRLAQRKRGIWIGPDLTPPVHNFVCEVEARLAAPTGGWALQLSVDVPGHDWLGARVGHDGRVCLQREMGRGTPLPWTPALRSATDFHTLRVEHEAPTVRLFVNGRYVGQADVPHYLPVGLRLYLFSGDKPPWPEARVRRLRVWRIPSAGEGRPPGPPLYQADFRKPVAEFPEKGDAVCGYDRGRFFVKTDKGGVRAVGGCPSEPVGDFYAEISGRVTAGNGGSWAVVCGAGRQIGTWVEVRQDGYYRVRHVSDGRATDLLNPYRPPPGALPGWQPHPALKPHAWNTLGLAMRGRLLTVSFNGQWACDVTDLNYAAGTLQLAARAEGEPVRAEFERLRVWSLGAGR